MMNADLVSRDNYNTNQQFIVKRRKVKDFPLDPISSSGETKLEVKSTVAISLCFAFVGNFPRILLNREY